MRIQLRPTTSRRRVPRIGAAVAVLAVPLTLVAPPTVSAEEALAPSKVTIRVHGDAVTMPGSLRSSRYHFVVSGWAGLQLLKADRGYTRADLVRDLRDPSERSYKRMMSNLRFFGGVVPQPGETAEFWETLYAGTYFAVPHLLQKPRASAIAVVRVHGSVKATAWPGSSGVVTLGQKRIDVSGHLPRRGRLVVRNQANDIDLMVG